MIPTARVQRMPVHLVYLVCLVDHTGNSFRRTRQTRKTGQPDRRARARCASKGIVPATPPCFSGASPQAAQTGHPTRPQANRNRRRSSSHPPTPSCRAALPRRGTLRISMSRERTWGPVSVACLEEGHRGVSHRRIVLIRDPGHSVRPARSPLRSSAARNRWVRSRRSGAGPVLYGLQTQPEPQCAVKFPLIDNGKTTKSPADVRLVQCK